MVTKARVIQVPPDSEMGKLLAEAEEAPIVLERNGDRFRVTREEADPFANYDPDRAWAAFNAMFGQLKGVDIEQLKADIREERDQDSIGRPADR